MPITTLATMLIWIYIYKYYVLYIWTFNDLAAVQNYTPFSDMFYACWTTIELSPEISFHPFRSTYTDERTTRWPVLAPGKNIMYSFYEQRIEIEHWPVLKSYESIWKRSAGRTIKKVRGPTDVRAWYETKIVRRLIVVFCTARAVKWLQQQRFPIARNIITHIFAIYLLLRNVLVFHLFQSLWLLY